MECPVGDILEFRLYSIRPFSFRAASEKTWERIPPVIALLIVILAAVPARAGHFKEILEQKYEAQLERLEVVSFSPTTKVLWFDWQLNWWGSLNVVEVTTDGKPLYWYDIPDQPTAQYIERVRVVTLSGQKYLEVIDCTHMGNGMLYLYELRGGVLRLKLKARVIANLSVHFSPRVAKIVYHDLDQDGDDDVVLEASCVEKVTDEGKKAGRYYREFLFQQDEFREQKQKRIGNQQLMD